MWKKKAPETKVPTTRIQKLSSAELNDWFNLALMELGMTYDQWRYHDLPPTEVDNAMDIVTDLWKEIRSRK